MGKEKKNPVRLISNYVISHNGIFDFDGLFPAISEWYDNMNYAHFERKHSEKMTSTGKYIEANWVGEREVTDYVVFKINLEIWLRDLVEIAVEVDGQPVKRQKGRIELVFSCEFEKNYKDQFDDREGTFSHFLMKMYERYIIADQLDVFESKLIVETVDFINTLKKFLS